MRKSEFEPRFPLQTTQCAGIAQLVEHLISNQNVVGSNPTVRSNSLIGTHEMKIEIRAAEGGDHAKRIVNDLAKAYSKYLTTHD